MTAAPNNARLVAELQAVTLGINLVGLDRLPEVMRDGAAPAQTQDTATMTDANTVHGGAVAWRYRWVGGARSGAWKYCHDAFPTAEDRFDAECEIEVQPLYLHLTPQTDTDAREKVVEASEATIERLCTAMQDGVGCTPWESRTWDRDGGVSRDLVRDSVRRILAALKTGDA